MNIIGLSDKGRKVTNFLKVFEKTGTKNPNAMCDDNTFIIIEIDVNSEHEIFVFAPKQARVIFDRVVDYSTKFSTINMYNFNKHIFNLGDPDYFSSDMKMLVFHDCQYPDGRQIFNSDILTDDGMMELDPDMPEGFGKDDEE